MTEDQKRAHERMLSFLPSKIVYREPVTSNAGVKKAGWFREEVIRLRGTGMELKDIADLLGCARSTVIRYLKKEPS